MPLISPPEFTCLRYTEAEGVALITLHRPERRNALDARAYAELEAVFESVAADAEVRCVVLTGADPAFCAGDDLKEFMSAGEQAIAAGVNAVLRLPAGVPVVRSRATPASVAILECDRPLIAAVNGAAIGWGLELALYADIRLASARARFAAPYVKLGLISDVGGFSRLPAIVGPSKAAELLLTGDAVDAEEARRIGLVSQVTPHEELLPRAMELAARIAANPALALRYTKEGLRRAPMQDARETGSWANEVLALLRGTSEHKAAVAALARRTAPP